MSLTRTIFIPGSRLAEAAATAMASTAIGCCNSEAEATIDAPFADALTETATEVPPQASVASADAKSPVEVMQVIEGPK